MVIDICIIHMHIESDNDSLIFKCFREFNCFGYLFYLLQANAILKALCPPGPTTRLRRDHRESPTSGEVPKLPTRIVPTLLRM